jgi:uncharacterized protein YndB with AHSA1/START domain
MPEAELPPQPEGGLEIRWVFEASREQVWREWTTAEAWADWFGGPESPVPLDSVEMDVRPGGRWKLTMHAARGEIHWDGEYLEIEEPRRLVFTVRDDPSLDLFELCTVELTDTGDGRTEMRLVQSGNMPPGAYKPAREGWMGFMRRMDERLAA